MSETKFDGNGRETCSEYAERLSAYALADDGDLSQEERSPVEAHLEACNACREELDLLRRTAELVRELSPQAARLDATRRGEVLEAATSGTSTARQRRSGFLWGMAGLAAAAAVAVAAGTWVMFRNAPEGGELLVSAPEAETTPTAGSVHGVGGSDERGLSDLERIHPYDKAEMRKNERELAGVPAQQAGGGETRPKPAGATDDLALVMGINRGAGRDASRRTPGFSEPQALGVPGAGGENASYARESERAPGEPIRTYAAKPVELAQRESMSFEELNQTQPRSSLMLGGAIGEGGGGAARYGFRSSSDELRELVRADSGLAGESRRRALSPLLNAHVADGREPKLAESLAEGETLSRAGRELQESRQVALGDKVDRTDRTVEPKSAAADPLARENEPAAAAPADGEVAKVIEERQDRKAALETARTEPAGAAPEKDAAPAAAAGPAAPADRAAEVRARIDRFLTRLDRQPGETPQAMFFRYWGTNPFLDASERAQSTFGVDVDTASYTLARNYLYERSVLPPPEAVRTEEFINYFENGYAPPSADEGAFAIHPEVAPSPFAHEPGYLLLRVGLKAREVPREERRACSLVFVVDTSGSMRQGGRLELVKEALRLLSAELDEGDMIGIVAFDREARTIIEPTPASEKERILTAIGTLAPNHNTNVNAGLVLGYEMAARAFRKDAANRVLLLSDGVANTGVTDQARILENVRSEREKGIYLTTVGVGMGNLNDRLLEYLADRGNGQCVYVDRIEEARKVFVDNLTGALETVARDAKIQVELDPERVLRYRQIGYENRALANAQFRDDTVDAGEVGAGHEVTALYEIKLRPGAEGRIATVRLRYLTADHGEAVEVAKDIATNDVAGEFAAASPGLQLAALVAEFAEILRESYWARGSDLARVSAMAEALLADGKLPARDDVAELVALMKRAEPLVRERDASRDEVARVVDALKEVRIRSVELPQKTPDDGQAREQNELREERRVEELRVRQQELRERLERLLLGS